MNKLKHDPVDRLSNYNDAAGNTVLQIGRFSYFAGLSFVKIDTHGRIVIGNFTSIADDVVFFLRTNHHKEWLTTYPFEWMPWDATVPRPKDPHGCHKDHVTIGNDVWIGQGVHVMPGVTIGDGAVIGAGAFVAHDVRPYAVMVGRPARETKRRFDDATVEALLRLRWWDRPTAEIRKLSPILCSGDIAALERALAA